MDFIVRRDDDALKLERISSCNFGTSCLSAHADKEQFQGNQKLEELHIAVEGSGALSVVVQGPSGCGKTSLLRDYLSLRGRTVGDSVMVVHLGEQIDSKVLLGTFTCTAVPGEFVWMPGLLTKCVLNGHWIVLEDIDFAPPDVISLLLPLVKTGRLNLPGYYEAVVAARDFKLFLTQRTTSTGCPEAGHMVAGLLKVLEDHSVTLTLPPHTTDDIEKVISSEYPDLETFTKQLALTVVEQGVSLRHVLKLCNRIVPQVAHGRLTSVPDMMLDLLDCFCGHLSGEKKLSKALKLSHLCGGLSQNMVEQLCFSHMPSLQSSPSTFSVGRSYIGRSCSSQSKVCYSHTQSSLSLLEAVSRCVQMAEPVLLVGETGVGKTATVSYLASVTGYKLVVMNLSQQTDSIDLLGGYKPVQMVHIVAPLKEEFEELFRATFSLKQNGHFLASVQTCVTKKQWIKLLKLMVHSVESAHKRTKRSDKNLYAKWGKLGLKLKKLRQQLLKSQTFAFTFDEGALVEAVKEGWWILLDEVNLASAESLQCLSAILEAHSNSLLFMEKPDSEPVTRHPDFRLFCCMNPSTDVGKKSLPENIRNRFTELYVEEPTSTADLSVMIQDYLKNDCPSNPLVEGIVRLYRSLKELSKTKLLGGTGRSPHYSLRNLCRALEYASNHRCGSFHRSLYEGFCMSFLTELCQDHHQIVVAEIVKCLSLSESVLTSLPPAPGGTQRGVVQVAGYWLPIGEENPVGDEKYILTPSVKRNLHNLSRVVSARKYPVLLQGPTSAGKTSLVKYLAKATGHHCLRINNHEHTDLQEYIGMYCADENGELVFQEGVLVEAMRKGYWIILDELNLAPTDVLEALNRVLDDNRELFIPETRKSVKAHPHFMLFGTQNPPGAYGGRKVLSRAFRNRFIELHYDDIPSGELVNIVHEKSSLPLSYAKKMVAIMKELQVRRTASGVFSGKYGLITLRDLFRWAERYRRSPSSSSQFRDWEQQLAEDGFMLLAGRLREVNDEQVVLDVIERHFKRNVEPIQLYGQDGGQGSLASQKCLQLLRAPLTEEFRHLVWTSEFLRMAVLTFRALSFDEPVLLVGHTGCGKTTLCQLFSTILGCKLVSINCHMHSEAADFLGGLKPTRSRGSSELRDEKVGLFEWQDGVVVKAMQEGCCLLVDEISLADDAVLERLNSVLETERRLLVSERSRIQDQAEVFQITASPGFAFMATMNPGGDYGKKELSPALRNRFVELWCPSSRKYEDLAKIIDHNLNVSLNSGFVWSSLILHTIHWIKGKLPFDSIHVSVRDLLTWVRFMNATSPPLPPAEAFYHGAHLVLLDSLGCREQLSVTVREHLLQEAQMFLQELLVKNGHQMSLQSSPASISCHEDMFGIHPFFIKKGPYECKGLQYYSLDAPGPCGNAYRLLRGMQVGKPLLIEGPPGVGKTSLVAALASYSGHHMTRINLSEHTDISDLFGCDLPVEGGKGVRFQWRDGPLLRALKTGDWVLLDEINLASQSVLEGLNAVLDHRGEVFVPELGITFSVQPNTKLFACQNPMSQGGGRKGLPKSFLNRFTIVFVDVLSESDYQFISHSLYPDIDLSVLQNMITFNSKVEALVKRECGTSIWEFNLRDILRWCQVLKDHQIADPCQLVEIIYCRRLRSASLRAQVVEVCGEVFCDSSPLPTALGGSFVVTEKYLQVGHAVLARRPYDCQKKIEGVPLQALHCQLPILEAVMMCVERGWMTILVGGRASGKTSVVRTLAQLVGQKLVEFPMNSDTDTTELLGGFQQVNFGRHFYNIVKMVEDVLVELLATIRHHQNGKEYTAKLGAMKNSSLPKVSGVLQEVSNIELLGGCEKLKQCLLVMEEVSSHLPTNLSYDFGEILSQVVWLKDRIQQGDSGGQFEWVDSVLVTSLRHGHWLSITNCNVCNPSVLDRLNAVVEPGGVLSVDERGVVGEEGVMTVKPHPNFRLFLLMDPAHGEISRAMRNRGIEVCILPEETLGSVNRNKEDWRSLLLSAGVDSNTAKHVLTSVAEESVSPVRLLQGVYCSSMVSQRPVKSNWKHLEVPQLPVVCESSGSASDLPSQVSAICQHPDAVTVQSHFSVILKVIRSHSSNEHGRNYKIMDVDAALQVFTSHASVSDYHMRKGLMTTLVSLCASDYHVAGVVNSWCTSLQEYANKKAHVAIERGDFTYNVPNLLSISNPMVTSLASMKLKSLTLEEKMLVLGTRVTSLKELLQWHSRIGTSTLSVSYQAYTGQLQLETMIHPSVQLIQPFLSVFINHLSSTLVSSDRDSNMEVVEWLAVIIHSFSRPVHSLTQLAGLWTVFKTRCISPSSAARKSELVSLMSSLQPLEKVVHNCCFFAEVRDSFCQSVNSMKHCNPLSSEKEKIGSISCFKELSSEDSICTVGTYQHKVDQMKILLSTLWLNGCSVSNTPLVDLQQKLMLANSLLRSTVAALGRALKFPDLTAWLTGEQLPSESLSELCCEAQRVCPDHSGPQFWQRLCHEISAAFNELAFVKESLEMAFGDIGGNRDLHGELTLLCGLSTGCVHVGTVVTNMLLPTAIDPVSLKEVDYKCYQMLAAQQSAIMKACDAHYLTTTGKTLGDLMQARSPIDTVMPGRRGGISPYVSYVVERKEFCEKLFQSQKPPVLSSSAREKYSQMVSVCTDVVNTFCSSERVASLLQGASVATQDSFSRVETWSRALRAAVDKLHSEFPSLEDVAKPFTTGLLQTVAGVTSLMSFRLAILSPQFKLLSVLRDSSQFPFATTENGSGSAAFILQLLDSLTVITEDISALKESERQQFHKRMLLIGVKFSKCFISNTTSCTTLSRRWYSLCSTLLKYCWLLWNRAEQANRAKMEQESSLYRYRTKTHNISLLGEGEVDDEVVRQIFPIYDEHFERLSGKEDSSNDDAHMEADEGVQEVCQFTYLEMREVFDLHQQLFTPQSQSQHHPYQLFETMRARYSFAAALAHKFDNLPGLTTDYCLFGAHARMCKDMLTELTRELPLKQRNIYKESVVSEAVKVGPVVNGLKERVEELLMEWPNHPGLVQVQVSCGKVLSLSVQEPLMKILAGLEYILRKSQDWEAYAASHVSLRQQLDQLTQLILDWRRLELRSWRSLFEECSSGVQCEGSKWWFHIYSLCQESTSNRQGNNKELLESVHEFVEVASLGEFTIRLKLLRAFATDMFLQGHPTLGNLLANTVNYYQQFAPLVTSHSSKITAVIDKEFNDLVRIMRWNDGNYWALKASTEKSHRTLVKFMRKLKGALSEPVHPLLTAGALQTNDSDEESSVDNEQLKIPHTVDLESTDLNLTDTQQQLLHSVTLGTFAGSDPHSLTAAMAIRRMKEMVCEYSSSAIYQQWNTTVNDFSGEIIETVKQLQSLDFLDKLEGDKRKSAIKLNLNQKRKAIVELFKYLKKQGLSRHGELNFTIELKCEIFQLPVIEEQVAVEIPDQWTESIQKYFYHSIGRLASLQSAFVTPTKDLSPTQLKCCKGYASHLVQLICSQRKTLSSACSSIGILQHRLQQLKFLVGGELYTLQVAEYMHWQSTALAMVEVSLELVHDFKNVVETLPENVDTSTTAEAPPILSCGDRSIANRAITMLQDKVPDLQILFDQLMLKEKTRGDESVFFVTRKDVQEVAGVCSQVESFCNQILDVLHLVLGRENHRVAMFEFLEIARSYLITTCQQCREWIASAASTNSGFSPRQKCCETQEFLVSNEQKSGCNRKTRAIDSVSVLQNMVLAVQRVMQRHRKLAMHMQQNSEELLEIPCCLYLHTTSTEGINDMNPEAVVGGVTSLLTTTVADVCEGSMKKLVPVVSLLDQYISLLRELVLRLALAHRTFCKLSSILLALFTDLVSKGVCAPPEAEEVEGEGGTDFEAAEGGGFDDGLGAKNVSNEVDAENLEDPTKKSGEEEETLDQKGPDAGRENGEEDAVDMTQDFGGDVADLPEEDEESEGQDWEDLDKEMGELGGDNPEQIDRNMWVPEEEQDETEPQQSEEQQEGSAESDEAKIVAQEGQPKPCRSERGQEPRPAGEDNENDKDEDTLVAQGSDQNMLEEHNQEIEDGDPGFDLDNMDQDEMEREEKMSSGEEQVDNIEDSVDDIEEDGSQYSQENEPNTMEELNNEPQTSEVAATQSLESKGQTGAETLTSDENLPPNSSQQEQQESTEVGNNKSKEDKSYEDKAANGASTSLVTSSTSQQEPKGQKLRSRLHHRPLEDYSLAGQEERLAKRPRLVLERTEGKHTPHERMESDTVQHLRDEGAMEHDAVVWDAAPLMQPPGTIPPTDLGDPTDQNDDSQADNTEQTRQPQFSDNTVDTGLLCPPQDPDTVVQEEQMETEVEKEESSLSHAQATMPEPHSFFVNTSLLPGQQGRVLDEHNLREGLMEDIKVLHAKSKDVDAEKMWQRYELLMSGLAQSLCEELRLALTPTQASQLKGDYRTGKRLNMRRIIPYIASYFQNDQIWLRRTKPSKRDYQVLVAVDDSASMNENECNQMAYESLAMISSALYRLECGQIGILRFGENAELLHGFDEPFTVGTGAHVLQQLSFSQSRTNFAEMLQVSNTLFTQSLRTRRGHSSPLTSQLLLVLSDGRGVFADGTTVVEVALRSLNELGVLTVFVILDTLSKESVLNIKVPSFTPGKAPVIRSYLETFPFSFYIVLQDIKSLPIVLGKALQQWFQLISGQ